MLAAHTTPRPAAEAVFRELSEGAVVLHLGSGQYHGLNATGALIWSLLDGRRTVEDIVTAVRSSVADTPPGLHHEVSGFLEGLRERGLVAV